MDALIKNTKTEIDAFCALINKLLKYPRPPTSQVGGGKHFEIDYNTPGPGWTLKYCNPFQNIDGRWAYPIDQVIIDASSNPEYTKNLTGQELSDLLSDISSRETLDASWFQEI